MRPRLLNRTRAAEYLGVNRRTIEAWERNGLPVIRINGLPYHTPDDLDAYLVEHRQVFVPEKSA
jgi:phage terminase Nu1 subunit (DNA packaging protein)